MALYVENGYVEFGYAVGDIAPGASGFVRRTTYLQPNTVPIAEFTGPDGRKVKATITNEWLTGLIALVKLVETQKLQIEALQAQLIGD